jgi:hypothetical protein
MNAWIKANTNAPGDNLPSPYIAVDAKDAHGNQFVAMITNPGNTWAYCEDSKRFGVAACVEYWRPRHSGWTKIVAAIGNAIGNAKFGG